MKGSSPDQASTSPRSSAVLPSACCSVTILTSLGFSPASCSARSRKMPGSVPGVAAMRLPLSSATLFSGESLRETSAVHSGLE
jgi:hypothetical protein